MKCTIDYSPVSDFLKNLNSKSNILDLGCGYGTAETLQVSRFNNVFGIDPSNKRIEVVHVWF